MSVYYIYLISSLPWLHFGAPPPFSFEKFLKLCEGLISKDDICLLRSIPHKDEYFYEREQPTLKKWHAFDTTLRNELVKIRATRRHLDPAKYLRQDGYAEPYIAHVAMSAFRNLSILESEMILDRERWRMLDELSVGHYFDIDFLIAYAQKLLILERWERVRATDKSGVLEDILAKNE